MKPKLWILITWGLGCTQLPAQSIRSIFPDAPGADNGQEFFELQGDPGMALDGLFFLAIEGDGSTQGEIDQVKDLSGLVLGANGLLLWRDAGTVIQPPPDPATTLQVEDFSPDLENGTCTFLLVSGFNGTVGDDLDTDNDGALDLFPWSQVLDAVSMTDGTSGDGRYAGELGGTDLPANIPRADNYLFFDGTEWFAATATGNNPGGPYSIIGAWDASGATTSGFNGEVIHPGGNGMFLPVELVYFRAITLPGDSVLLEWATAWEEDNDHFEVQMSTDGRAYSIVGKVAGEGFSSGFSEYRFSCRPPNQGWYYFRLRQVDGDGNFAFSPVRPALVRSVSQPGLRATLVVDRLRFKGELLEGISPGFLICDRFGRVVLRGASGSWDLREGLDIGGLPAGSYFLSLAGPGPRKSFPFQKY